MLKNNLLKIALATSALALSTGAYAMPIQLDPTKAGIARSDIDADGTTRTFDQMGFNAASTIQVIDANNSFALDAGDTFSENGTFGISSYIQLPGTTLPGNLNTANGYQIFGTFANVTGTISNVIADANLVTKSDFVAFNFDAGGLLTFNIRALDGSGNATGAIVQIAQATVLGGSGSIIGDFGLGAPSSDVGSAENGAIDLDLKFTSLLNDFWLSAGGADLSDLISTSLVLGLTDMNVDSSSVVTAGNLPTLFLLNTTHNGSLEVNVPEPGPLALIGIGLLAFISASKRRHLNTISA